MKIEFDHEKENIEELIESIKITEKGDVNLTDAEIKAIIRTFSQQIQGFEIGVLLKYLSIKNETDILRVSELTEILIEDIGWEKFLEFSKIISEIVDNSIEVDGDDSEELPEEVVE